VLPLKIILPNPSKKASLKFGNVICASTFKTDVTITRGVNWSRVGFSIGFPNFYSFLSKMLYLGPVYPGKYAFSKSTIFSQL
jgi:hypothetical protein